MPRGSGRQISGSSQKVAANQQTAIHMTEICVCHARAMVSGQTDGNPYRS
jgi:hypothetical protein